MSNPEPQASEATAAPRCWIYRSPRRDELYLYLRAPNGFDLVPEPLRRLFGEPVFVMELTLDANRRLARVETAQVIEALAGAGFFLQMPPVPGSQPH